MPKRKKRNNSRFNEREDIEEIRGKGTQKEKRKARRHFDKKILDEYLLGDIIPEDYDDYIEGSF